MTRCSSSGDGHRMCLYGFSTVLVSIDGYVLLSLWSEFFYRQTRRWEGEMRIISHAEPRIRCRKIRSASRSDSAWHLIAICFLAKYHYEVNTRDRNHCYMVHKKKNFIYTLYFTAPKNRHFSYIFHFKISWFFLFLYSCEK